MMVETAYYDGVLSFIYTSFLENLTWVDSLKGAIGPGYRIT